MATVIVCEMKNRTYYFNYQTKAFDLWQLSMYGIYGSILGMCNIIFTVSMALMTIKFWTDVNLIIRILLLLAICLFTIIQPFVVYLRAKKQVATLPDHIELGFDDAGIHVKIGSKTFDIAWSSVKGVSKKPSLIVILTTTKHGFILTNKVLESAFQVKDKEDFYRYVKSKIMSHQR